MSTLADHAELDDWDQLIKAGSRGGSRGALVRAGAEAMSYEELCQAHIDAMLQVGCPACAPPGLPVPCVWQAAPLLDVWSLWSCSCAWLETLKA